MTNPDGKTASRADVRLVAAGSLLLVLGFGLWGLIAPAAMSNVAMGLVGFVLGHLGWFYLAMCSAFLVLSAWLAFGPYGRIRLGPDDSRPEFSTPSWIAMLFAGGMGSGLVFWGVAEPVSHFAHPPGGIEGSSAESARLAMVLTNLHWGLHAWAIYAVCALVLAYFMFRKSMPGLISTPIRASLSASTRTRTLGVVSDVVATFAVVFGLAGSLGQGVLQVRAGITELFHLEPTTMLSILILLLTALAFILSASTGLSKGIQYLSNLNMVLILALLLVVVVLGPTSFVIESFLNGVGGYISSLPEYSLRLLSYENQMDWTRDWTLTYLIWWIAWGPFVGIFIARISRGRTIREFCAGVILIPTIFSIFWFAALGGTGIWIELNGGGGLAELVREDVAAAAFAFLDFLPLGPVLAALAVVLIFVFLVTSADSGTYVISMMSAGGQLDPGLRLKLAWGTAMTLLTMAILLSGSIEVAKAMAAFGAVPFTLVLVLQIVSFLRTLREDQSGEASR